MRSGLLYFIKDEYYDRFKNCGLLGNKEMVNGKSHSRPCCYLFSYNVDATEEIYWMIPISSKVEKYKREYKKSIDKYGICDNISFCHILGEERAILPQNLCPVTKRYIENIYLDTNTQNPIILSKDVMTDVNKKARKKIRYNKNGKKFGMSDTMTIYNALLEDLS